MVIERSDYPRTKLQQIFGKVRGGTIFQSVLIRVFKHYGVVGGIIEQVFGKVRASYIQTVLIRVFKQSGVVGLYQLAGFGQGESHGGCSEACTCIWAQSIFSGWNVFSYS